MTSFRIGDPTVAGIDRYPLRRSPVIAAGGMVATSQPLATQAGVAMLAAGGSAVDAAIATAAALTVVEPTSNGLGSDAFALVWDGTALHGLNGSGRWPANADPGALRLETGGIRERGWPSVTVPGAVDSWRALHERFGRLPMRALLEPARRYAAEGHPVAPVVARFWQRAAEHYPRLALGGTEPWATVFAPAGRAPRAGERWGSGAMARCFERLSDEGLRDFYEGSIAEALLEHSDETGGWLDAADLRDHESEWVEPISIDYHGIDVWEIPPNGQGIAALMALGLYERVGSRNDDQLDPSNWHAQIESMKLAFSDSDRHVADMEHSPVPVEDLLAPARLDARAAQIGDHAGDPAPGDLGGGGTVYLAAADGDGMMISFIQSNYAGFGSGVVEPRFGISLQNRAAGFDVDPASPNAAAPRKRPRHTIIPGFLTHQGRALGAFGVMGGEMQPQGHLQVVAGMVDHGLDPQAALDAPRWRVERDWSVMVEPSLPRSVIAQLRARGHRVVVADTFGNFGRGQIIVRSDNGVFAGGSEPRADGQAAGI